ncbi:hypothetical protein AusDCA_3332 [Desulfitobacterium sp. AusDCA]
MPNISCQISTSLFRQFNDLKKRFCDISNNFYISIHPFYFYIFKINKGYNNFEFQSF